MNQSAKCPGWISTVGSPLPRLVLELDPIQCCPIHLLLLHDVPPVQVIGAGEDYLNRMPTEDGLMARHERASPLDGEMVLLNDVV
jgi:hypothetical protein